MAANKKIPGEQNDFYFIFLIKIDGTEIYLLRSKCRKTKTKTNKKQASNWL